MQRHLCLPVPKAFPSQHQSQCMNYNAVASMPRLPLILFLTIRPESTSHFYVTLPSPLHAYAGISVIFTGMRMRTKQINEPCTAYGGVASFLSGCVCGTMAERRLRALRNNRQLARYVLEGIATGKQLGTGSYGSVEEVLG